MSRLLAVGGMARIYSAHRHRDGWPVAIKLFQPPKGHEQKFLDFMLHEAHALRVAAGPFVVELVDHGVFIGQPFLVLEWLDGRTLAQAMTTEPPRSLERVALLFRKILDAVEALHERGVIHADLKSENVMLSPHDGDERVRLLDLGAARVNGTGEPLEPSSDVYAAGLLLFELLTGTRPFSGTGSSAVVRQQPRIQLPRPSRVRLFAPRRVCDAVDTVVATALAPTPAHRYADVASLRFAFDHALGATTRQIRHCAPTT